jgi:mannose-6-phosphate isomerase-like protein (cupin superfamily)
MMLKMGHERVMATDRQPAFELLDLTAAIAAGGSGAILARETDDLDLNLVRFADGAGVGAHVNREVDVVLIALAGSGIVRIDEDEVTVVAGSALLIPKNSERSIRSQSDGEFAYLSVHRRRARLMPGPRRGNPSRQ